MKRFVPFQNFESRPLARPARRWACWLALCAGAASAMAAGAPSGAVAPAERQALLDLYARTAGDQWTVRAGWGGPPGTECDWYGVRCDAARRHVTGIHLPNNQLRGRLPRLGALLHLQALVVSLNHLHGPLPALTHLPALRELKANNNLLGGPLPELHRSARIERVVLANNRLDGDLPPLAGLAQLREFDVSNNQLSGLVPSLRGLDALRRFDASHNRLRGVQQPQALPRGVELEGNPMRRAPARARP